ncbi:hypothetical protein H4F98_16475 [Lysobacter spongiae]|uniref:Uncharacterized protein n=1 Tax=Marilutibacter spongiae TaxID=2025720 RepID=A0A7W3TPM9_9GAMM|nr:hypothetical protein [Lysobacter spongiae]
MLQRSLGLLRQRWIAGCRDRETALRLLFLCWYGNIEPPSLTGIEGIPDGQELCEQAYASLGGSACQDPEVCFVVALMIELCPWCLGNPDHWETAGPPEASDAYRPHVSAASFAGRGVYGEYFTYMLTGVGG